ncbi:MAG: tetratricopeptide repeat protein [Salinivirgaceae bacterium]|jgi:tetratricopeptide (TPR) repeat protein|nr:tetratricopeptide repeat protein [Bacteroidales bacterium]
MNRHLSLLFLALIALTSCVSRFYSHKLLDKGKEAIAANDYKNGIAQINKAIKVNKQLDEAYFIRGEIYEKQGKYDEAIDDYIKAYKYSNDKSKEGLAAGRLLYEQHRYKESLPYLLKSYERDSTNQLSIYYLMLTYSSVGQAEDALLLSENHQNYNQNPKLIYAKAVASDSLGMTDYAGIFYRSSIEKDKTNPDAYISYANLLLQTGNEHAAMEVATEGIELFNNPELMKIRMSIFTSWYMWHDAVSEATTLYNLTHDIKFIERRARFYRFIGLLNNACNDYDYIIKTDSNNTDALFNRAIVNLRLNNEDEVFTDLHTFLNLKTEKTPTWQLNRAREIVSLLSKEIEPPVLTITKPEIYLNTYLGVKQKEDSIRITGSYDEKSSIIELTVNDINALNSDTRTFDAKIPYPSNDTVYISTVDIYDNNSISYYTLTLYDSIAPEIVILKPKIDSLETSWIKTDKNDINIKLLVADNSYINSVLINSIQLYSGIDKRTVFIDTLITIPADNKIIVEVTDMFNNQSVKTFNIAYAEDIEKTILPIKDILVLSFDGMYNSDSMCINLVEFLESCSNVDISKFKNTTKKSLERLLLFDLNELIEEKNYKNVVLCFNGRGITWKDGNYWLPTNSDTTNKSTWFNLSFLSSVNNNLNIEGTVAIITNDIDIPEHNFSENKEHEIYTFVQYSNNIETDSTLTLDSLTTGAQKIDFIKLLEQISAKQPKRYTGKYIKSHNIKPMILFIDEKEE